MLNVTIDAFFFRLILKSLSVGLKKGHENIQHSCTLSMLSQEHWLWTGLYMMLRNDPQVVHDKTHCKMSCRPEQHEHSLPTSCHGTTLLFSEDMSTCLSLWFLNFCELFCMLHGHVRTRSEASQVPYAELP